MTGPSVAAAALVMALAVALRTAVAAHRRGGVARRLADATHPGERRSREWRLRPPPALGPALAAAAIGLDAGAAWSLWILSAVAATAVALVTVGAAVAVLGSLAAAAGPVIALRALRGRGDARVEASLPAALEAVARALRSGASSRQAVEEAAATTVGPLGEELSRVAVQVGRGAPLVSALEGLARRRPLPGVRLAVAALCLGVETGGAQARAVDGVAHTLRDRLAVAAEVRALATQARISAVVIGLAPVGFGAFAAATDPRTSSFAFHTAPGLALICSGLALDGLGWLWMNRLCRVGTA